MVLTCIVLGCSNKGTIPEVSYFSLTKARYETWMRALGRDPNVENLSKGNVVCSDHFLDSDKIRQKSRTVLREGAVPCLKLKLIKHSSKVVGFSLSSLRNQVDEQLRKQDCQDYFQKENMENTPPVRISTSEECNEMYYYVPIIKPVSTTPTIELCTHTSSPASTVSKGSPMISCLEKTESTSSSSESNLPLPTKRLRKYVKQIHNYSSSERKILKKLKETTNKYIIVKKKLKISQEKSKRLLRRITSMKEVLKNLKHKKMISDEALAVIEKT